MRRLITAEVVEREFAAGRTRLSAPRVEAIVSPAAWSRAQQLGVIIDLTGAALPAATSAPAPQQGHSERLVDPSGIVVVRGESVELAPFPAAGANRKVAVADLVTGRDGSPMTAGMMSWSRDDSFPWTLDYDEVDLVLEGVLHVTVDGRVLEAKPGDVVYLPKGSSIIFGTPWRTKVFYVTYPADWAAASRK
jgi:ethanolamine utilization protein EutQ